MGRNPIVKSQLRLQWMFWSQGGEDPSHGTVFHDGWRADAGFPIEVDIVLEFLKIVNICQYIWLGPVNIPMERTTHTLANYQTLAVCLQGYSFSWWPTKLLSMLCGVTWSMESYSNRVAYLARVSCAAYSNGRPRW